MHLALPVCLVLAGAPILTAQAASQRPNNPLADNPLGAAKARLGAALTKTAALADTAFAVSWAPYKEKKGAAGARWPGLPGANGSFEGSWHMDRQHLRIGGDDGDQLVLTNRRTIAKDGNGDWKLRPGRLADGSPIGFAPDVQLLLEQLAGWDLAVVQAAAASLDDRPVEIVSVALNPDQVAEAVWCGLIPEALVQASLGMQFFAAGGPAARVAPPAPKSTVDIAITIDPATSLVQRVHFRAWTKEDAGGAVRAGGVFIVRAGGVAGAAPAEEEEEEEEPDEAKAGEPMKFEDGLPKRPRKKTSVVDYTVRLSEHGKRPAPVLSDLQKKLLGR